jgi:hypothetical protein
MKGLQVSADGGSMMTLTGSQATYTVGDYTAINNDWGAQDEGLTIGVGYTMSIAFDTDSLQSDVVMTWSYPNELPTPGAWAYPEISWGDKFGYIGTMNYSTELFNLKSLAVNYDIGISGETSNFDVGIEIWTSDLPWNDGGKQTDEIMVKVHTTDGHGLQDGSGSAYDNPGSGVGPAVEIVHPNWGGGFTAPWTFVTIDETSDTLSGSFDFGSILRQLVAQGVVAGTDYVSGVELGAEPITGGTGTLTVNNYAVSETLAADAIGPFNATDFNATDVSDILISNTSGAVDIGALGVGGLFAYTHVALLGSEWRFEGSGDLLGDGKADMLLENSAGAVAIGELGSGGTMAYTNIAALGPEWSFEGTGDFFATGQAEFLIENTSGAVDIGSVSAQGVTTYQAVAALGPEWKFVGVGDYQGDGRSQFLIENTSGAVVVGEVVNGKTAYTTVAGLGPEWSFEGSGEFLGDGRSQVLIENSAGAVALGAVGSNGKVAWTTIGGLGPEWKFVGVGAYSGTEVDSFLIENTTGAVYAGAVVSGKAQYTLAAALGPEWSFHA